jgi:putative restriction endonuclease
MNRPITRGLLEKISDLNTWARQGQRAPHKPLYFLYCLGRLQAGKERLTAFEELRPLLVEALRIYGPSRKTHHAEYPFWHLAQGSDALCEIVSQNPIRLRPGAANPSASELLTKNASGGFKTCYFEELKDLRTASAAAHRILDAHFPPLLHQDVLDFFGVKLDDPHALDRSQTWEFKKRVLEAYEGRCSVTGIKLESYSVAPALDSIHICWPQAGGNDDTSNGIFMNLVHAKLFSLGLLGIQDDFQLLYSSRLNVGGAHSQLFSSNKLLLPSGKEHWPSKIALRWHRAQVFKN